MDRIIENGFFVHCAVIGADDASLRESYDVFYGAVVLEADVDGAAHHEVHFFNLFDCPIYL